MEKKIKTAKDRLRLVNKNGEEYELKLLKELEEELSQELVIEQKNTLTIEQQKKAIQTGIKLADKMTLDTLKLKYQKALSENSGIKNEKIEKIIVDLEKKILK
jgi:hypothetical protein